MEKTNFNNSQGPSNLTGADSNLTGADLNSKPQKISATVTGRDGRSIRLVLNTEEQSDSNKIGGIAPSENKENAARKRLYNDFDSMGGLGEMALHHISAEVENEIYKKPKITEVEQPNDRAHGWGKDQLTSLQLDSLHADFDSKGIENITPDSTNRTS